MTMAYAKRARKLVPILGVLIPVGAIVSAVNVVICMSTGSWIHSYERVPISNSSSTHEEFLIKRTVSGLWNIWSFNLTEKEVQLGHEVPTEQMDCMSIEYFRRERYLSDPNDSTNAIALSVTSAGPIFISATVLLVVAIFAALCGYQRPFRVAVFVAGCTFIVAGLILLIGIVVYLSVLQSEIGPKLRPRNSVERPLFSYEYGYSFIMVVMAFLATETTGICAVFYYMYWHQLDWAQKATKENQYFQTGNTSSRSRSNTCEPTINLEWCQQRRRPDSLAFHPSSGCNQHNFPCEHHTDPLDLCKGHEHLSRNGLSYDTEYEIPIPPPPPPASSLPRDYTTLTSCSDDNFVPDVQLHSLGRSKCKDRRITPV